MAAPISITQSRTLVSLYRTLSRVAKQFDSSPSAKTLLYRTALSPLTLAADSAAETARAGGAAAVGRETLTQSLSLSRSPSHPFASLPSDPLHVTLHYHSLLDLLLGDTHRMLFLPSPLITQHTASQHSHTIHAPRSSSLSLSPTHSADGTVCVRHSLWNVLRAEARREDQVLSLNERLDAGFAILRNVSNVWSRAKEIERERQREREKESPRGAERATLWLDELERRLSLCLSQRERDRDRERVSVHDLESERDREREFQRVLEREIESARESDDDDDESLSPSQRSLTSEREDARQRVLSLALSVRPDRATQLLAESRERLNALIQRALRRADREEESAERARDILSQLSATRTDTLCEGVVLCAHPLLAGALHRTVVLLLSHNTQGSYGIALNVPTPFSLSEAVKGLPQEMLRALADSDVFSGGPVRRLQWIHTFADCGGRRVPTQHNDTNSVPLFVGGDLEKALVVMESEKERDSERVQKSLRFFVGCCCWTAGQLETEMKSGYWTAVHTQPELLFRLTEKQPTIYEEDEPPSTLACVYTELHKRLGADYAALADMPLGVDVESVQPLDWSA